MSQALERLDPPPPYTHTHIKFKKSCVHIRSFAFPASDRPQTHALDRMTKTPHNITSIQYQSDEGKQLQRSQWKYGYS